MFNLIVKSGEWADGRDTMAAERVFEHTDRRIAAEYKTDDNEPDFEKLSRLPCLFMVEGTGNQSAYVGRLLNGRTRRGVVTLEYEFDRRIPPLRNANVHGIRAEFGIDDAFEFSRNHWAVKDTDLYRIIARNPKPARQQPRVFNLIEHEVIDPDLVSVMMPFGAATDQVFRAIRRAVTESGYTCQRADEMWEQPEIIADIVSLIDRSSVIIFDCSGRNPNVFYELGIAHTLGREFITVAQDEHDIPFDIRHLRCIFYQDSREGRRGLREGIAQRLAALRNR